MYCFLYNFCMFQRLLTNKIFICSFFLIAFIFIGIASVLLFVKNELLNTDIVKNLIKEKTTLNLEYDNLDLRYSFFAVNLRADKVSINAENSGYPLLNLEKPYIKINLLPLLFKKVKITCFYADYIEGHSKRLEDGSLEFLKYFTGEKSIFKLDLSDTKINIKDYDFVINDYFTKNNFMLDGHTLISNGFNFNRRFTIKTDGYFYVIGENSKVNAPYLIDIDYIKNKDKITLKKQDIVLTSLNLSFLKEYIKNVEFKNFDFTVDINSITSDKGDFKLSIYADKVNLDFDYKGDRNTIISNEPLINEIEFNFKDKDFIIKNAEFWADGVNIKYNGGIKYFADPKKVEPNLKVKINNTDLKKLSTIIPDTLIPLREPYIKRVKKYGLNALADGELSVRFKNREDFNVKGKINFEDVYVVERPKDAKTAFGFCEFLGREVLIKVLVNAPNNAFLTVVGKMKMKLNPDGEFEIKSNGPLDMEFAYKILMPVQNILSLKLGPLPYMKIKGHGEIDLKTKGNKEKANLKGIFKTKDAILSLQGLNTTLTNGKVDVIFSDTDILFNGAKGIIEGANASIDGAANTNGDLDIKVKVSDVSIIKAMNIAQTSPLVTSVLDGGEFLKSFIPKKGNIDFYLNLYGNAPPNAKFGEKSDTVFAKGKITFKNNSVTILPEIKGENINGELTFENNAKFNLNANIFNSPFNITGKVEQKNAKNGIIHNVPSNLTLRLQSDNIKSESVGKFVLENLTLFNPQNRLFAKNLAQIFNTNKFNLKGDIEAKGLIYSNSANLDLSNFDFSGFINGINQKGSDFIFKNGNITLKNKNLKFNNLRILASNIDFLIDGNIDKFTSIKPFNNLKLIFFKSSFYSYMDIFSKMLPQKEKKITDMFKDYKGYISGKIKLYSDKIDGEFIPYDISFKDVKRNTLIELKNGLIKLKNDKTYLKSINLLYGSIPFYIDGYMQTNGAVNPELNIFATTVLNEEACDKFINPNMAYPIEIDGEIFIKGRIQGTTDNYTTYLNAIIDKNSDFSFMGVKLGDVDVKREISSKIRFKNNYADVNHIKYFKQIQKDNRWQTNYDILKVSGGLKRTNKEIVFDNFKVLTPNPAPVRFMNILFRRSFVKDGIFTSNLVLNGALSNFRANGNMNFSNVLIPMYNASIDNIEVELRENKGEALFKLSSYDTVIDFIVDFENKITLPVVIDNIKIHSEHVLVDNLVKAFSSFTENVSKVANTPHLKQTQSTVLSPSDILIKNGIINVDKIVFNGIEGNSLKINFSNSSKPNTLVINNSSLGIAGGLFKGKGEYNYKDKFILLSSDFVNCDANELTKAFLNLSGELYGNSSGKFELSMKDFSPSDYVKKIKANAEFEIANGKMPKLGSIEYLLRASNFIKSGLFGLTLNNLIELLKPYKQGEFNKITGNLKIENAIVKDLKIYSQGENLSTYTSGIYDITTGISEIEILGKLSKNISNLLGPIGNTSVVSVLNLVTRNKMNDIMRSEILQNINKIPFLDLNNDDYRLFSVKLKGEVSKTDAVKSFTWLN